MSVLAWTRPGVVDWGLTSTLPPAAHLAMITLLMTAIGVGWGISWVTWASDYSRFVPRTVSSTAVFWYSYVGMFVPTVWLAILGATVASVTKDTDPAKMVSAVFGGITSILVLLMVLHGPIATNILNVYSAALAALSMGLRLSRTAVALIAGVVGYLVTIYFVFQPSFAKAFDNWMISLLLWMSPWAGVILADFFSKRKGHIDVGALYQTPERSAYGDINWGAIAAFLVGLIAGWTVEDGLVPALQGPISTSLLSGADLSWLVGIVVAGAVYLAIGTRVVAASVPRPMGDARRSRAWWPPLSRDRWVTPAGKWRQATHRQERSMDEFLRAAIQEAELGFAESGIPIGSVVVHNGQILGRGHNRRVQRGSVVLHGEMDALENAGRQSARIYRGCTIYTTLSPCAMCSGAILLYGIPRVVVGENRTFRGEEDLLRSRGVAVEVLQDPRCHELMAQFIRAHPSLWAEDIGT